MLFPIQLGRFLSFRFFLHLDGDCFFSSSFEVFILIVCANLFKIFRKKKAKLDGKRYELFERAIRKKCYILTLPSWQWDAKKKKDKKNQYELMRKNDYNHDVVFFLYNLTNNKEAVQTKIVYRQSNKRVLLWKQCGIIHKIWVDFWMDTVLDYVQRGN